MDNILIEVEDHHVFIMCTECMEELGEFYADIGNPDHCPSLGLIMCAVVPHLNSKHGLSIDFDSLGIERP